MFKKGAANFNQPIDLGDPLILRATIAEASEAEVGLEFQIRNRDSGAVLITGLATQGFPRVFVRLGSRTLPGTRCCARR